PEPRRRAARGPSRPDRGRARDPAARDARARVRAARRDAGARARPAQLPRRLARRRAARYARPSSAKGGRMAWHFRILVVANVTADSPELIAALKERASGAYCSFTLLVPAPAGGRAGR